MAAKQLTFHENISFLINSKIIAPFEADFEIICHNWHLIEEIYGIYV